MEKLKGTVTKQLKELELVKEPGQLIKIIKAEEANRILRNYIAISSVVESGMGRLVGYVYKDKTYPKTKQADLYKAIVAEYSAYLKKSS